MSRTEVVNVDVCVRMCDKILNHHANDIRTELMSEFMDERKRLINELSVKPVDNCSPEMSKSDLLEYRLKSAEIDTKYITQVLNDLVKTSEKNNHDTTIVLILEVVVIVIYLLKPCIMYFIQAKYRAEKPHDGCRDIVECADSLNANAIECTDSNETNPAPSDVKNRKLVEFV
jgi:hypothetical protein